MFESESHWYNKGSEVEDEIAEYFRYESDRVKTRSLLSWGEHCTECAMPECFQTCDLYEPRFDGKCRRFRDGIVIYSGSFGTNIYLLGVRFKKWSKFWAVGKAITYDIATANEKEKQDLNAARKINRIPLPIPLKKRLIRHRYSVKKLQAINVAKPDSLPELFRVEIYNPSEKQFDFTLSIKPYSFASTPKIYHKLLIASPGFNRIDISVQEIHSIVDIHETCDFSIIPNNPDETVELLFGLMDFITLNKYAEVKSSICKCIVWDLDNTIWKGILIESDPNSIEMISGIREVIIDLDSRGILHSIASKNNLEDVLPLLKRFGIEEFFLYPQINWGAKSEGIKRIAQSLNIGLDSLIFVDDSEFEREEIHYVLPQVQTIDAASFGDLLSMDRCNVMPTEESKNRRKMYIQQIQRETELAVFGDDYFSFLKNCEIKLKVSPPTPKNLDRIHSLIQRTNQMNFSGNRYSREEIEAIIADNNMDCYVLRCDDRFGSYGAVGFCIVDNRLPAIKDLTFSCRIQSKRVEHAFLSALLRKYRDLGHNKLTVFYNKTPRNAPAGKVFDDFDFIPISEADGVTTLEFDLSRQIPDDKIIQVEING